MKQIHDINHPLVAETLNQGGIIVAKTDTLYGVLARADNEAAVSRVYELKTRDGQKSPIVLIADLGQVFDELSPKIRALCQSLWPAKVSLILPSSQAPSWIRRQNASVAYRLPDNHDLRQLILKTGPLIAPSANPEGWPPALTIDEAVNYFADKVDLYVDGGEVTDDTPSRLLRIDQSGGIERLR